MNNFRIISLTPLPQGWEVWKAVDVDDDVSLNTVRDSDLMFRIPVACLALVEDEEWNTHVVPVTPDEAFLDVDNSKDRIAIVAAGFVADQAGLRMDAITYNQMQRHARQRRRKGEDS